MNKIIINVLITIPLIFFGFNVHSQKIRTDFIVDEPNPLTSLSMYLSVLDLAYRNQRNLFNPQSINYYNSWKIIYRNSLEGVRSEFRKIAIDSQFIMSDKLQSIINKNPSYSLEFQVNSAFSVLKKLERDFSPTNERQQLNLQNQSQTQSPSNTQTLNFSHGKYVGQVVNGNYHGYGTYTSAKSGIVYTGQFKDHMFEGDGTLIWPNGTKFVGKWQNGVGVSGTMIEANGNRTSGSFKNGVFTPSATQSPQSQSQPSRPQANNQPQSRPSVPQANNQSPSPVQRQIKSLKYDNSIYKGETVNDEPNGKGQITYFNGDKFEGNFINGKREGLGTFTWKQGDVYTGNYKNNVIQGSGRYDHVTGERYIGEFKNGKMDGRGTFISKDGTKTVGTFKDNQYVGP